MDYSRVYVRNNVISGVVGRNKTSGHELIRSWRPRRDVFEGM